jgi:hypothetical protein
MAWEAGTHSPRLSTGKPGIVIRFCETMNRCGWCLLLGGSARIRKIRYAVAMSLDGHIAGPNGEYDWIGTDSEVDFAAFWSQFDTLLMGRRTFELAVRTRGEAAFTAFTGITSMVFSRTLKQQEHPHVTVVPELNADWVRDLKT